MRPDKPPDVIDLSGTYPIRTGRHEFPSICQIRQHTHGTTTDSMFSSYAAVGFASAAKKTSFQPVISTAADAAIDHTVARRVDNH
jgi:hypothetical protein